MNLNQLFACKYQANIPMNSHSCESILDGKIIKFIKLHTFYTGS
jgi:hypothetical protein